ncbi:hypothetical protein SAMN05444287_2284 [Octadecabacter temperatus]|uniref:Uncharacterized protein n=1 Tax=Octadecabacter temperatus TaxID=1458307 RepID=A0A0K0Y1M9_9RHOB|nr:DUF6473 family protein [Octadecabacter temperatus]AKS44802.1 hypothetical protein OSB_02330 [Octadecabacter temperatus]SIO35092.1 hypothetical protein SAMN05444287_2284 [Octadecabacter temperatus]
MKTEAILGGAMRSAPCSYGLSKLLFRGPRRPTDGRYIAFLGGSETFGRYIPKPFPELIETAIGEVCINLGNQSAGPDVFLHEAAIESLCHDAAATVIQIPAATNLSNPFYRVHPRRNDRFIAPTERLIALYPELDFAEIAFTGHLITRLRAIDDQRFIIVRGQLCKTWVHRMKALVAKCTGPTFLLWFATRAPQDPSVGIHPSNHPAFVTRPMVEALRPYVSDIIEVIAKRGELRGMVFPPLEALAAQDMLGVEAHEAAAKALRAPLLFGLGA